MSDVQQLPISTACPGVDAASQVLAAVLVGEPDVETSLVVSEALDVLGDVQPPLPPLAYPEVGVEAGEGIARALAALGQAVEEAPTAAEALRAGRAAHLLRDLLEHGGDDVEPAPGVLR